MSFLTACFMVNANERNQKSLEGFLGMLRQIRNVRYLSLSLKTLKVMAEPDLQGHAPIIFENLRMIKFMARCKCMEVKMPVDTVMHLLERAATDVLIFDDSKKLLRPFSKAKTKDTRNISVPAHVIHFLLESSPFLELFSVEIPKESSLQE